MIAMQPYTLAVPAYLNSRAYFRHPLPPGGVLTPLYPREMAQAFAGGRLLAGLLPVAALPALAQQLDSLGEYGIAATGPVQSVLLHSRLPLAALGPEHALHLTSQSATSVRLLALLIGYRNGFDRLPLAAGGRAAVDGELLIGDAALCSRADRSYPHVTDLAETWHAQTGLPFVFARWVIRRDAPAALRASLEDWLAGFVADRVRLHRQVAGEEAMHYGLTAAAAYDYLEGMQTALGPAHLAGQALFQRELERHRPEFARALRAEEVQ